MNAELLIRDLSRRYGDTVALHPTTLHVQAGEFVAVLGASGCGKSTLLGLLMGIIAPDSGEIHLAGRRIDALPAEQRDIAMVFQSYALFPHMNVRRNLAFGLKMKKVPAGEQKQRIEAAAQSYDLGAYLDRMPAQLSGGQQQRVALARAAVMRAALMLYDEPLSNIDAKLREILRAEISALHRQTGGTALYVTHDHTEAMTMADRIVVMDAGRIVETGTPLALYRTPRYRHTAERLGSGNLVEVTVEGDTAVLPTGMRLALARRTASGRATVLIRPESVRLTPSERGPGLITRQQFVGALIHYQIDLGPLSLRASAVGTGEPLAPHTRVDVQIDTPLHILEVATGAIEPQGTQ